MPQTGACPSTGLPVAASVSFIPSFCFFFSLQVVDFFNGNLKRRRQKRKEAKAMMKLKRLSSVHTEANGAVIGDARTHMQTKEQSDCRQLDLML